MMLKKIINFAGNNVFIISLLLIVFGFVIMSIDTSDENGGKSFHQLTLAPVLLLLGYSLIIFAIMNPNKKSKVNN